MHRQIVGLLAGLVAIALSGGLAAAATPNCTTAEPATLLEGWSFGRKYQRAPAIDDLRSIREGANVDRVQASSDCLRRYYSLRAGRQQTALDAGSGLVFIGGVGSAASAGVGATTQTYWNYAALLPVVIAQFNASEPTRDLYAGGRVGLDVIGSRYYRLNMLTDMLAASVVRGAAHGANVVSPGARLSPCAAFQDGKLNVEDWAAGDDKAALLADYRKLRDACAGELVTKQGVSDIDVASSQWKAQYASAYVRDLLRLDDEIVSKDRDLRYSPGETLSAVAAAPFAAVATLLSGENSGQALDRLKTQQTFATLNVPLEPVPLPACPPLVTEVHMISPTALARRQARQAEESAAKAAKPPKTLTGPTATEVDRALTTMQGAANALNASRGELNYQLTLASNLARLATYDRLVFSYDAPTAKVSVVLATTPPASVTSPAAGR